MRSLRRVWITSILCATALPLSAQAQINRVVEDIPAPEMRIDNLYKVSADRTPSGFPVPRYVSLKFGKVNGRTGPSLKHPIAWTYQRRGLPLIVVAETEMWRKVRDINGDESWMRKPALSGERTVLAIKTTTLYSKPRNEARISAQVSPQALLKLENCDQNGWCLFRADNGLKGWAPRHKFWGALPLY